jgi:hypothetical protein
MRRRQIYSPGLCDVRRAARVVKPRLFAVFWSKPSKEGSTRSQQIRQHSSGKQVLCVSAEVDQTERAAAYQTPKQSELTSYNKYLQIPTLCSISYAVISPRSHSSARPREGLSIKSLPAQFLQRGRAEAEKQYLTTCITAISSTSTTIT